MSTPIISIQKMVSGHIIKHSVKRKRFHFQRAENSILIAFSIYFQKIMVQKIPSGGRRVCPTGQQPIMYAFIYLVKFWVAVWLPVGK